MARGSAFVQRLGIRRVDHLPGKLVVEAGPRHRCKIARARLLPILLGTIGAEASSTGEGGGGLPFPLLRLGVQLLVQPGQRLVERVGVDAGELQSAFAKYCGSPVTN